MRKKEEIRKEIIDLEWHALPYYERWAYPKAMWERKKFYLKRRLRAQKWEIIHVRILWIILALLAIGSIFNPRTNWDLTVFFAFAFSTIYAVELLMKRRLIHFQRALKLKKKSKNR